MDIAKAIELLVPEASYFGSVTSNQKSDYNNIIWNDTRPKPTWKELEQAWQEYNPDTEPTTEEILLTALLEIQQLKQKVAELEGGQ